MEENYYSSENNQKFYINYFDALYLLNIVFKENKNYEFIDTSHVESIWNSIESVSYTHLTLPTTHCV